MVTYVFGIGGTGSRILRSLTMLLASGVFGTSTKKEIVPIIIDYDGDNGDTKRTQDILEDYQKLHKMCYGFCDHDEHFFCTPITKLKDKVGAQRAMNFKSTRFEIHLDDIDQTTQFSGYLGHSSLNDESCTSPTRHLLESLYNTEDGVIIKDGEDVDNPNAELHMKLHHGFRGCPNIGCVVTRQITCSNELSQLETIIKPDDRIIIIGSLFGGTGASGIPTLVDYFKNGEAAAVYAGCPLGVIAVMPYFKVADSSDSPISSKTFIAKTKAALDTYDDTVRQYVNALYLVGDSNTAEAFDNNEGGSDQRNDAHIVEMVGAMMLIDFINKSVNDMNLGDVYEFGLKNNPQTPTAITYNDFYNGETCVPFIDPMSRFVLFKTFCQNYFIPGKSQPRDLWLVRTNLGENKELKSQLSKFFDAFEKWIIELEGQKRPLKLYNIKENNYLKLFEYKHLEGHGIMKSDAFDEEDIREALSVANGDVSKANAELTNQHKYGEHVEELFMVNANIAMRDIFKNKIVPFKNK